MTDLHPIASTPATVSRATSSAAAADHALSQLGKAREGRVGDWRPLTDVLAAGFEAVTHGLLATAAAIEESGSGTADVLGERIADIDDTLTALAVDITDAAGDITGGRWRRAWHRWGRRQPAPASDTPVCDCTSAGVIIRQPGQGGDLFLVFDRATFPTGVAPVAGHVDEHGGWDEAARAEVTEETGLTVTSLRQIATGWRANVCRRLPGRLIPGHMWVVYEAAVTGELAPSPQETRDARWLPAGALQVLADRTAAYAHGKLTTAEFIADPGIEPVWVQWLTDAGITTTGPADLAAIERIAAHGPDARFTPSA